MAVQTDKKTPDIVVRGAAASFRQEIISGKHHLLADEPASAGGSDTGPDPYEYLLAALGVCTSMTVGLYARRKQLPLENIIVSLWHMLDRIDAEIELTGSLTADQHAKLMEIAAKCPIHRTLTSEINIRLRPAEKSSAS